MNIIPTGHRVHHPLITRLHDLDIDIRIVGGYPRDLLIARLAGQPMPQGGDLDLIIRKDGESLESFMAILTDALTGYRVDAVGKRFGVLKITAPDGTDFDIAVPRTEHSTGPGRAEFIVNGDPSLPFIEDGKRRDLRVNAMFFNPLTGDIEDHFGGLDDLTSGEIHMVGNPDDRLNEDCGRALRIAGLVARHGYRVAPATFDALRTIAPALGNLDAEAVFKEFHNPEKPSKTILSGPHAAQAFDLLSDTGILDVLFPEFAACRDFEQHNPHHCAPVHRHLLDVTRRTCELTTSPQARFAAFLHDIGKPATFAMNDGRGTFYGHEDAGAQIADAICRRLKSPTTFREHVTRVVALHMRPRSVQTTKAARKLCHAAGDTLDDLLAVYIADRTCHVTPDGQPECPKGAQDHAAFIRSSLDNIPATFDERQLALTGHDLSEMGLRGKAIGAVKRALTDLVVDGTLPNDKGALRTHAQTHLL